MKTIILSKHLIATFCWQQCFSIARRKCAMQ